MSGIGFYHNVEKLALLSCFSTMFNVRSAIWMTRFARAHMIIWEDVTMAADAQTATSRRLSAPSIGVLDWFILFLR